MTQKGVMMENFFSNFKSQFDSDLGGRYFAGVLEALFAEHPEFLCEVNPKIPKKIKIIDTERERNSSDESNIKKYRRSDLSIDYSDNNEGKKLKTLNIEIKWKDAPLKGQIEHYIKQAKKNNSLFALISLERQDEDTLFLIEQNKEFCASITCPELYRKLEAKLDGAKDRWLLRNFLAFLKENAMIYDEEVNYRALVQFMRSSIGFGYERFGILESRRDIDEIPGLLKQLMGNISKIAGDFHARYNELFSRTPYTGFYTQLAVANKYKNQPDDEEIWCGGRSVNDAETGVFCVYSKLKFLNESEKEKEDRYSYLEMGLDFGYDKSSKGEITWYPYVEIYCRGEGQSDPAAADICVISPISKKIDSRMIRVFELPDADKLYNVIERLIKKACQDKKMKNVEKVKALLRSMN